MKIFNRTTTTRKAKHFLHFSIKSFFKKTFFETIFSLSGIGWKVLWKCFNIFFWNLFLWKCHFFLSFLKLFRSLTTFHSWKYTILFFSNTKKMTEKSFINWRIEVWVHSGNSQNFLCKFVKFFLTLALKS